MENQEYIILTKDNPIFIAECDYFGNIEETMYKDWLIEELNLVGRTFATNFAHAVNKLHEWIIEANEEWGVLKEYPKCKFNIWVVDGAVIKNGQDVRKKVYSISASKAKKYLL